jgi:tRNA threonylcarbamoyladenosine biosynthesis protein TsaB
MKVLAFELSTGRGSLAWANGEVHWEKEWPNDRKNSGPFFENLKLVSENYGWPQTIIVGLGPGSYAGVRIAISAALGLSTAAEARLIGFPSVCALECDEEEYCVIGDARRQSFSFTHVRRNNPVEGPALLTEIELRDKLEGLEKKMPIFSAEDLPQFHGVTVCFPSAGRLARLVQDAERSFALPPLEPLYLREPHITMPKKAKAIS